jgi:hypothetical protein
VITGLAAVPAVLWLLRNWTINQNAGDHVGLLFLASETRVAAQSPIQGIITYLSSNDS